MVRLGFDINHKGRAWGCKGNCAKKGRFSAVFWARSPSDPLFMGLRRSRARLFMSARTPRTLWRLVFQHAQDNRTRPPRLPRIAMRIVATSFNGGPPASPSAAAPRRVWFRNSATTPLRRIARPTAPTPMPARGPGVPRRRHPCRPIPPAAPALPRNPPPAGPHLQRFLRRVGLHHRQAVHRDPQTHVVPGVETVLGVDPHGPRLRLPVNWLRATARAFSCRGPRRRTVLRCGRAADLPSPCPERGIPSAASPDAPIRSVPAFHGRAAGTIYSCMEQAF